MWLNDDIFSTIVESTPLVSLDLIVRNGEGEMLLGRRMNRPAQGMWFVPGGRILKNEPISQAFSRLTLTELGIATNILESQFMGVFEHFYPDNFSGEDFSTHYVVLAYQVNLDIPMEALPNAQHDEFRWWTIEAMSMSDEVHLHNKWYIESKHGTGIPTNFNIRGNNS